MRLHLLRNIDYAYLALAGAMISCIHIAAFYYSHDTPKWFIYDVTTTLYIIYTLKSTRQLQYSYFGGLILVLVYLMMISLWWAPHTVAGIEFTLRFINAVLFAYCLLNNLSKEKLTNCLLNTVFWSALSFSLLFILERYLLQINFNLGTFSPIGFINNTSAAFNIWIPGLVLYCIKCRHQYWLLALSIFTLVTVVSILIETGTRGAILGLSISEMIVFMIVLRKKPRQAIAFLTITALMLLGIGIYHVSDHLQGGRLDARLDVMKGHLNKSAGYRLRIFKNTWQMTTNNPWGVGINNFEYLHPKYAQPGTPNFSNHVNEHQILRTPYNIVLKIFSELGYLGGVIFVLILGYCLVVAFHNAFRGDYLDKWLFVGVSATLFHTMVSAVLLTPVSLFFFVILSATIFARSTDPLKLKPRFIMQLPKAFKILYLFLPVLAAISLTSEYYAFQGRLNFDGQSLQKALLLNPQNDRALLNLSQFKLYRSKDLTGSLAALNRFLALYPYHIAALLMKAERHYQLNELYRAQLTLDKLLNFYPSYNKAQRLKQLVDIKIKQQKHRQE